MKNNLRLKLCVLLLLLLTLAGCVTRDNIHSAPDIALTPDPLSGETLTPSPEPTPAPLEYAQIPARDPVEYGYCQNDSDVFEAVGRIRANHSPAVSPLSGTDLFDGMRAGDKVAHSGDLICLISDKDLVIVRFDGENCETLSRTHVGIDWRGETDPVTGAYQGGEKVPSAVFCMGDRVAILSDRFGYHTENGLLRYSEYISVDFYDISDPAAPRQTSCLGQSGTLRGAEITDGRLLLITEYQVYEGEDLNDPGSFIPAYYSDDSAVLLPGDRIMVDYDGSFPGGALMGVYDPAEGRLTDIHALMGVNADAAAENGRVVFYSPRHAEAFSREVRTENGSFRETAFSDVTDLFSFRVEHDRILPERVGTVPGTVSDSGCLDIHNGSVRCLASLRQGRFTDEAGYDPLKDTEEGSALFILDDSMETVDTLFSLPDGSPFGWAGFAGDRILITNAGRTASCVFSGSEWGTVTPGGLSGRFIRAWGDTGYVFYDQDAMGQMTVTVSDRNMIPLASRTLGSDHSSTLENHRAYIADETADLLTLTADDSFCIYGFSAENGIELRADIYLNDWAWNAEGLLIGDTLYVVDSREVKAVSAITLEEVGQLLF